MPRLLVVDDEPWVRGLLHDYFSSRGYDVTAAPTGEEGLCRLREERPHLVLLDINLPDVNGLEVLRRAQAIDPQVRVLMLTGVMDEVIGRQALQQGACDYLIKPVDLRHLEQVVWYVLTALPIE